MLDSYKVVPMAADGDLYALYDPKGAQVAMGTRDVCQALLSLLTSSQLLESPPRDYGKVAPTQRVRSAAVPAEGGAESASGAAHGGKVSASVRRAEAQLPPSFDLEPYSVFELLHLGSRSAASYWYVSLFVVIVIGSALLTWAL